MVKTGIKQLVYESVFEQTLKPKQILIINDNSNDGTCENLKDF